MTAALAPPFETCLAGFWPRPPRKVPAPPKALLNDRPQITLFPAGMFIVAGQEEAARIRSAGFIAVDGQDADAVVAAGVVFDASTALVDNSLPASVASSLRRTTPTVWQLRGEDIAAAHDRRGLINLLGAAVQIAEMGEAV